MKTILSKIDPVDVITFLGLGLLGYGLYLISLPLAFIVIGSVLTLLGIVGAVRRGANN